MRGYFFSYLLVSRHRLRFRHRGWRGRTAVWWPHSADQSDLGNTGTRTPRPGPRRSLQNNMANSHTRWPAGHSGFLSNLRRMESIVKVLQYLVNQCGFIKICQYNSPLFFTPPSHDLQWPSRNMSTRLGGDAKQSPNSVTVVWTRCLSLWDNH